MGLETGVTKISDLNPLWPLTLDMRAEGDDHLRNIKVALQSLLADVAQIGLCVLDVSLTVPSTTITWTTGTPKAGDRLTVTVVQDATGGRAIAWSSVFADAETNIPTDPGDKAVFNFVGKADGKWYMNTPVLWIEVT
ncbi:MAG TPA: hypothetical protein VLH56_18930 [Dissulfurispiraceae bacterium]|nr:hypothetical protein [Dissulfurispiraceae bacterium]